MKDNRIACILSRGFADKLFPPHRQLIPDIDDYYELELAFYEDQLLNDAELLRNSAYFAKVHDKYTRHYLMCTGESLRLPDHSSSRLKSFFEKNIFRTGYGTHGLFPYRGKFHPQMIKGLMNVMGLKPGSTVLDPMMGSGTVPVEASLMGINSVGIDASPFCRFMAQTKIDALTMDLARARNAMSNIDEVFAYFRNRVGAAETGRKIRPSTSRQTDSVICEPPVDYMGGRSSENLTGKNKETVDTYNFLLLAYLDAAGYSERSDRKSPVDQFRAILQRYVFVAEKIQKALAEVEEPIGTAHLSQGDARSLVLDDETIDGVIFSPPYSFAIDYLDNDAFHLKYLGVDIDSLQNTMVGLRGRTLDEKYRLYREDMQKVLTECARVMRLGAICTIIVGTNSNQLSKVLHVPADEVPGLHQILIEMAKPVGLELVRIMSRTIVGISNTMRREQIIILQKS